MNLKKWSYDEFPISPLPFLFLGVGVGGRIRADLLIRANPLNQRHPISPSIHQNRIMITIINGKEEAISRTFL
jgi:hypothetical protein